jgi:hypothetical protein
MLKTLKILTKIKQKNGYSILNVSGFEDKELLINIDIPIPQNNFVLIDIIAFTYEIEKGTKIGSSAFHTTQHSKLADILINVLYKDKPYKIQIYSYYNSNFCFRSKVSYTYNLDD